MSFGPWAVVVTDELGREASRVYVELTEEQQEQAREGEVWPVICGRLTPVSEADATSLVGAMWVTGVIEHGGHEVTAKVQQALNYVRLAGR